MQSDATDATGANAKSNLNSGNVPSTMGGDVPQHVLNLIAEFLVGAYHNDIDLRKAHLRPSVKKLFTFIVFMYVLLIAVGIVANLAVFVHITWHKLYKDPTYAFFINNVLSDIVKCVFVIPISLYVLLVQNWMLGELLCSFLPMLQDIPIHVTTLTFVLMAWDRYRMIRNPNKPRLPAFVCVVGTWLTALCLVLPYPIYIIYVDLGKYSVTFDGIGFCVVNLTDDMQEYMRGIFLIMYAGPLSFISYLYVKSSQELQSSSTIVLYETRHRESRSRADSHATSIDMRGSRGESDIVSQFSRNSYRDHSGRYRQHHQHENGGGGGEPELDIPREKRTNKYLVTMVTIYAICMGPLMVLRVARLALLETYENAAHFDITYTMFVWCAFLPTCTTPLLYAAWQMSRPAKERLKGYFRFSSRKPRHSCDTVETSCVSATSPPSLARTSSNRSASRHHQHSQQAAAASSGSLLPQYQPQAASLPLGYHQPHSPHDGSSASFMMEMHPEETAGLTIIMRQPNFVGHVSHPD